MLRGVAGIGKTALAREIAAQAQARGWRTLRVDATEAGRPYPVVSALAERLLLDDAGLLDQVADPARNVLALLTRLAAPARPLPGPLGRHQVVGAIRRLLHAAAGGAPLLLHVDDVHLADDADSDALMQLAIGGGTLGLLLCMRPVARGCALDRGLARLQRAGALQLIELAPLDEDECRRLVQRAAPHVLNEALVARVLDAAQGHPFAAIELARCAATAGDGRLPATTAEAVLARLCDVPAPALMLLKWMALCGDAFEVALVEALATAAQTPPMAALDAALMALGIPPDIPSFEDLMDQGIEYMAAQAASQISIPPEVIEEAKKLDKYAGWVDVDIEALTRQHVGMLSADSVSGSWVTVTGSAATSGTFRGKRESAQ